MTYPKSGLLRTENNYNLPRIYRLRKAVRPQAEGLPPPLTFTWALVFREAYTVTHTLGGGARLRENPRLAPNATLTTAACWTPKS